MVSTISFCIIINLFILTTDSKYAIINLMNINEKPKFEIEFYEDIDGNSEIYDFIETLRIKSATSKDARIQYRQVSLYFELLSKNGTNLPDDITKHIQDEIWELRPGRNRVLYFFFKDNKYILLSQFVKKTQKTPTKEIKKAKALMNDYIKRFDNK